MRTRWPVESRQTTLTARRLRRAESCLRMRLLIAAGESFALETTCSGKSYIPMLRRCREQGWRISFFYFWLPRPEDSVARVARRVAEGGHNIPTEAIHRRFRTGLWNALNLYLPMANRAEIYDNSDRRRSLIAQKFDCSPLSIVDPERWARMAEIADEKHDLPGNV